MQLHPELHRRYFQRVGDLNPKNLRAPTNLANISHQKEILMNLVLKKR